MRLSWGKSDVWLALADLDVLPRGPEERAASQAKIVPTSQDVSVEWHLGWILVYKTSPSSQTRDTNLTHLSSEELGRPSAIMGSMWDRACHIARDFVPTLLSPQHRQGERAYHRGLWVATECKAGCWWSFMDRCLTRLPPLISQSWGSPPESQPHNYSLLEALA